MLPTIYLTYVFIYTMSSSNHILIIVDCSTTNMFSGSIFNFLHRHLPRPTIFTCIWSPNYFAEDNQNFLNLLDVSKIPVTEFEATIPWIRSCSWWLSFRGWSWCRSWCGSCFSCVFSRTVSIALTPGFNLQIWVLGYCTAWVSIIFCAYMIRMSIVVKRKVTCMIYIQYIY